MKRALIIAAPAALLLSAFWLAPSVFASVTPTLSLSATGSGDNVQVTVSGDPNESVLLSYTETGSGPQLSSIGTTNSSGQLVTTISSGAYGLSSGLVVEAYVGGIGGAESAGATWPTVTTGSSLVLSQSALIVNVGTTQTITVNTTGNSGLYVSNNSNPSIANVSVSGGTITVAGNVPGSTSVTFCLVGNATSCASLAITVLNSGSGQLSFSQTNPTVVEGQNLPVTISGGSGIYQLSSNSNTNVVQASVSGSVLTLSTGSSSGQSSITVCTTDLSECGVVTATVGSASSVALSFSSSAPTVSTNESTTVNIYGPSGTTFYVSSNSSPSVVQANLSGSVLTLTGIATGSSTIQVCASTGTCNSLTATVTFAGTGGPLTLSQNILALSSGQTITVTISGGTPPYFVANGTSSVTQESVNGNILTVYGEASGTSSVSVCSSGGGCSILAVTVNGATGTTFSLGESALSLVVGGSASVGLSGNGSYYLSTNTEPTVASVSINGSTAAVVGLTAGNTTATLCESNGSCATLSIAVAGTTAPITTTSTIFTEYLVPGDQDAQVLALQQLLVAQGDMTATPNGYFGPATEAGVLKFQAAHNISQVGTVGPETRAALNALGGGGSITNGGTTLSQLQAQAQSLEAQLTQVLAEISQLAGQ